jgi:coniferyl-aldehyde dehydrogenase
MAELTAQYFAPEEVLVVTGGPEVAAAFSSLPFDHLIFTGSTATGRRVMQAAAANLVPVTLELGGKSPVVMGRSADLKRAGERIAIGKMLNAGQICLAPDYLLVPEDKADEAVAGVTGAAAAMYPRLLDNEDYASIVSDRHFERLKGLIADARDKGAEVIEVNPAGEDFANANQRKLPLTVLRGVNDDMAVMQEEIFGPVLPVMTYQAVDEAIDYINAHDRPLGLYYFGEDKAEQERVLSRTISGGVTTNDVIFHVSMEDLPFGGVGPSGMGSYHAIEGFREFSHARAVYHQPKIDVAKLGGLKPPYGKATAAAAARMMK